jgi:putative ABC transport system ATP-binding protein
VASGGGVHALRDVSLTIGHGDLVAIVGPSGSGKSTLLNLLGLLDRPTAGHYLLDGRDVSGIGSDERAALRNRYIGFVFQSFSLLPRTSARANVELPLLYGPTPRAQRRALAAEALDRVGLGHRLDHLPSQLSGGEQQRVAIARALVCDPLLVLADEPTGSLDSRTGLEILALLEGLRASGKTLVLVTHDPSIAARTERVIVVSDGRIADDGAGRGHTGRSDLK